MHSSLAARSGAARARLRDRVGLGAQGEAALPARHRQIHFGEHPRIEQRAVIVALGIIHRVALAQGIEAVALPGMHLSRERQGVKHAA